MSRTKLSDLIFPMACLVGVGGAYMTSSNPQECLDQAKDATDCRQEVRKQEFGELLTLAGLLGAGALTLSFPLIRLLDDDNKPNKSRIQSKRKPPEKPNFK